MRIGIIIQARMSSKRLPGKVLRMAAGKPLLLHLYERVIHCHSVDQIIVATSSDESDDPVALFCRDHAIGVFRGPLHDVAARFKRTLEAFGWDACVRVNGDSPLLDQRLIDQAVMLFRGNNCDLVTNVHPRTFPAGQSVEVIRALTFCNAYAQMSDGHDLEHVTPFFYRHPDRFAIMNFSAAREYGGLHLAVDTPSDFDAFNALIGRMTRPAWQYDVGQLADLYSAPQVSA
ncbi:MAG: hypothetical protein C4519_07430 [Desulfobacteraceae bacterium]|nr:MAG: hypothetical protein C4519_07430 [Desulfobacteraceae bacterium]